MTTTELNWFNLIKKSGFIYIKIGGLFWTIDLETRSCEEWWLKLQRVNMQASFTCTHARMQKHTYYFHHGDMQHANVIQ